LAGDTTGDTEPLDTVFTAPGGTDLPARFGDGSFTEDGGGGVGSACGAGLAGALAFAGGIAGVVAGFPTGAAVAGATPGLAGAVEADAFAGVAV
jgi:hypothetical protein